MSYLRSQSNFYVHFRSKMEWSELKNILLCREVLAIEPYKAKERTVQRAQAWQTVADNLSKIKDPCFKVDKRSVREHVMKMVEKFKKKNKQEEMASGICPEQSELDILLEEIAERMDASVEIMEEENERKLKKLEKEKEQAEDIRLKAMESLGETKKRVASQENQQEGLGQQRSKKRRSNGSELVVFLNERANQEMQLRVKDAEGREKQHNDMMEMLQRQQQQQQEQQQQQQQQFMQLQALLAQQQQQQNQLLLALLGKKI